MFEEFCDCWNTIDPKNHSSGMDDAIFQPFLESMRKETVEFIHIQIKKGQHREDYLELLNLVLLLFKEQPVQVKIDRIFFSPIKLFRVNFRYKTQVLA